MTRTRTRVNTRATATTTPTANATTVPTVTAKMSTMPTMSTRTRAMTRADEKNDKKLSLKARSKAVVKSTKKVKPLEPLGPSTRKPTRQRSVRIQAQTTSTTVSVSASQNRKIGNPKTFAQDHDDDKSDLAAEDFDVTLCDVMLVDYVHKENLDSDADANANAVDASHDVLAAASKDTIAPDATSKDTVDSDAADVSKEENLPFVISDTLSFVSNLAPGLQNVSEQETVKDMPAVPSFITEPPLPLVVDTELQKQDVVIADTLVLPPHPATDSAASIDDFQSCIDSDFILLDQSMMVHADSDEAYQANDTDIKPDIEEAFHHQATEINIVSPHLEFATCPPSGSVASTDHIPASSESHQDQVHERRASIPLDLAEADESEFRLGLESQQEELI